MKFHLMINTIIIGQTHSYFEFKGRKLIDKGSWAAIPFTDKSLMKKWAPHASIYSIEDSRVSNKVREHIDKDLGIFLDYLCYFPLHYRRDVTLIIQNQYKREFLTKCYYAYCNPTCFDVAVTFLLNANLLEDFSKGNSQFTIVLNSIDSITGDHLSELASLFGAVNIVVDGTYLCFLYEKGLFSPIYDIRNGALPVKLLDKLREWKYDIGYGHVPSLVAAGIAIDFNNRVFDGMDRFVVASSNGNIGRDEHII